MIVHVESVQRTFTKKLPDRKYLTYKDRFSALRLESLELRPLKADLIMCFKILKGYTNITPIVSSLRGRQVVPEVIV